MRLMCALLAWITLFKITEGFPSCERMEGLLSVLLQNGRFLELGLLHLAESATRSAHIRIRHLEESLERIQESSSMPESHKHQLQNHLRLFLTQAYFEVSDSASGRSHLTQHWGESVPNEMGENLLWSRYLVLRHKSKWEDGDIENSKRLLLDFRSLHNMKGWQSSSFLLAEIFRGQGNRGLYSDLILSQFEARCVNKMHVLIRSDKIATKTFISQCGWSVNQGKEMFHKIHQIVPLDLTFGGII
jgi:hypothetical protein